MHPYDITFKRLLRQSVDLAIRELAGATIVVWHNVELPDTTRLSVDLLGETADGRLIHIELQSTNDPKMHLRMAEYYLKIGRLFGRFPVQVLVYVGNKKLRMRSKLVTPSLNYSYRIIDLRDLDGTRLLASPIIGDNIIAILTRLPDLQAGLRQVLKRIAVLGPGERKVALDELATLAGLRNLGDLLKEETQSMPILGDIMDHDLFGPVYRQGEAKGRKEGRVEGELKGELNAHRRIIERRFGRLPSWAKDRLASLKLPELHALGPRILNASSLEDLLGPRPRRSK